MANKKKTKMSFNGFKRKCFDFFEMYKWRSFMSNLRVWESLPGDEAEDKTLWYCLWELRPGVTMILFYDYGEDSDDCPFVVYVDWKAGCHDDAYFRNGKFCMVDEFDDIEMALDKMRFEPTKYLASPYKDCVIDKELLDGENPDTVPGVGVGFMTGYSLLEAIDVLNDYAANPKPQDENHTGLVVWMSQTVMRSVLYEKRMKKVV